jgi:hypothetical protein
MKCFPYFDDEELDVVRALVRHLFANGGAEA